MRTYLLTWNPAKWPWSDLEDASRRTLSGDIYRDFWSCGNTKSINRGDRIFLLKQGREESKGILASGWVVSDEVVARPHWDEERARMGDTALRVDVEFDRILNPALDPLLSVDGLASDALSSVHWNTPASGIQIRDEAATELEGLWASHLQRFGLSADDRNAAELRSAATEVNESGYFSPDTLHDERERRLRQIVQRRGQPDFRNKLIAAYQARCAVTGCDAVAALEAAHIIPYCGPDSNHVTNGVLLRADIHSLFDLDLMAINPEGWTVDLVPSLRATSYSELLGRRIGVPTNLADHPSQAAIVQRWQRFVSQ